jgi:hypothetical protein
MAVANALAYYKMTTLTTAESFIVDAPRVAKINTFGRSRTH